MDLFKLHLPICRSHGSHPTNSTPGPKGLASAHKRQRADVGGHPTGHLIAWPRILTQNGNLVVRFTPWKINILHIMMEVWKIIFLSKWVICRFHVNLPGCKYRWWFRNPTKPPWECNTKRTFANNGINYLANYLSTGAGVLASTVWLLKWLNKKHLKHSNEDCLKRWTP